MNSESFAGYHSGSYAQGSSNSQLGKLANTFGSLVAPIVSSQATRPFFGGGGNGYSNGHMQSGYPNGPSAHGGYGQSGPIFHNVTRWSLKENYFSENMDIEDEWGNHVYRVKSEIFVSFLSL